MWTLPAFFRQQAAVSFTQWLLANFNGSGDLSGYTPEIGTTFVVHDAQSFSFTSDPNAPLTAWVLTGGGELKFDLDNASTTNAFVMPGSAPPVPDYYMDITLTIPSVTTDTISLSGGLGGRATYTTVNTYGEVAAIGVAYYLDQTSDSDRNLHLYFDSYRIGSVSPTFTDNGTTDVALGAATSVIVRAEFEGREIRVFVGDAPVKICTWTPGDDDFDTAANAFFSLSFADGGENYHPVQVTQMRIGDEFLSSGYFFWDEFSDADSTPLSSHTPNISSGSGYFNPEAGSLADLLIQSDSLDSASSAFIYAQCGAAFPTDTFVLTMEFTLSISVSGIAKIYFACVTGSVKTIELLLDLSGGFWFMEAVVRNDAGTLLYDNSFDVTAEMGNGTHTISIETSPSGSPGGTVWKLDGVTKDSDAATIESTPDEIAFRDRSSTASEISIQRITGSP